MKILVGIAGLSLLLVVLWDAFETVVLPRRVTRRLRLTRLFYRSSWRPWRAVSRLLRGAKRQDAFLSFFGPLSLLLLLTFWAAGLVAGFALLHWPAGSAVLTAEGRATLATEAPHAHPPALSAHWKPARGRAFTRFCKIFR